MKSIAAKLEAAYKKSATVDNIEERTGADIAVVTAPPGAGKSTLLPLEILARMRETKSPLYSDGKILMLEPRRLAARAVAERMAHLLSEPVGETVGYRVRFESRVSARTRIEVLTEGILTRMLVDDPTLDGVSMVIFDEFHERSLNSDVALALTRECQNVLRDDLRILIMSATIDAGAICKALNAPLFEGGSQMFPVDLQYADKDIESSDAAAEVARTIARAHRLHEGDILAFLPGEGEIRRCAEIIGNSLGTTDVMPLYGMLPSEQQRRAIAPSPGGKRKVVLATPVAETSITIEGVRVVVDSGFCRKNIFDSRSGLSRLETVRISQDMASQRAGRAGRVAPGTCYRLWTRGTQDRMAVTRTPEILEADLSQTALEVAAWGGTISSLPWLTPPPSTSEVIAMRLLENLDAINSNGRLTPTGRQLASIPAHPRIAKMLLVADNDAQRKMACDIAAILDERDPMGKLGDDSDLNTRLDELELFRRGERVQNEKTWQRIDKAARQYARLCNGLKTTQDDTDHNGTDGSITEYTCGYLLAAAYPERIARNLGDGSGRYALSGGGRAVISLHDTIASYDFIAIAGMNSKIGADSSIFMAAPLSPADVKHLSYDFDKVEWDSRAGAAVAVHQKRIGMLVIEEKTMSNVPREKIVSAICSAAAKDGLSMFDFNESVQNLQRRLGCVASWHPELELPATDTDSLLSRAKEWLPLYIGNASGTAELRKLNLCQVIWGMLTYQQQQIVERLAPSVIEVPTGSRIKVEYRQGADAPVLRVRLQECFGMTDTPCVDDGRVKVLMELLSPGFKPVQLTSDLGSFWKNTYFEVRSELRRRYPRHSWPDNPLEAPAVRGVAKR